MFNMVKLGVKKATFIAFSLAATILYQALAQAEQGNRLEKLAQAIPTSQVGAPFTLQERSQISRRFLANPQVAQRIRNQRVRVLSLVNAPSDKETIDPAPGKRTASILLFNYSTGKATRYLVDASSGRVLGEQQLPGRPSASPEEIQEAIRIIRANPEYARQLRAGSTVEGGFIVNGPQGSPSDNRFMEMRISNGSQLQRVLTVDLTTSTIASSRRQ